MSKIVIADSSCFIGLSKIGQLNILPQLFGKIIIPEAVYYEVVIRGSGKAGAEEVKNADWIENQKVKNELAVRAFRINLGFGESEVIALANECQADFIILDDWKARQTAEELELPVIGTIAILQKAVEKGIIENLPTVLENLRNAGFRFLL
jgi:predicted nucleic acid-binding protein